MFGKPALVPAHGGCDAQGQALLPGQGISSVSAAQGPDSPFFEEVDDIFFFRMAGPRHIGHACFQGHAHRVQALHELPFAQGLECRRPHAGHDAHVRDDIGGIGYLNACLGYIRAQGTHAERHHVLGAPRMHPRKSRPNCATIASQRPWYSASEPSHHSTEAGSQ